MNKNGQACYGWMVRSIGGNQVSKQLKQGYPYSGGIHSTEKLVCWGVCCVCSEEGGRKGERVFHVKATNLACGMKRKSCSCQQQPHLMSGRLVHKGYMCSTYLLLLLC